MNPYFGVESEGRQVSASTRGDASVFSFTDLRTGSSVKTVEIHTNDQAALVIESLITQATLGDNTMPYTLTAKTDMCGDVSHNGKNCSELLTEASGMKNTTIL